MRKCEGTLTNRVVLKLPCGSQWKLGLTKSSDGKVWIDKGWPEFAKQYSIARGHLLVFRYEGNSQFYVVIFDTTTTEIDYPNSNLNHFEKHIGIDEREVKEEPKDDDPVEHLGSHLRPCPKTRSKSPLPCSLPHPTNEGEQALLMATLGAIMIIDLKVLNSQLDERFCWSEFNEMSIFSLLCICISRNISKKKI